MAIIGIDLGTTTTEVAIYRSKRGELIKNEQGEDITLSIIAIDESTRELIVGNRAKDAFKNYAKVFKRYMGTDKEFILGDKKYNAIELSALLLKYVKKYIEEYLGEEIELAVIAVPANFSDIQRNATIRAGEMAGFKVDRLIHEPTAAALAFSNNYKELEGKVLVYDLGGGTFDSTILDIHNEVCDVICSTGEDKLGGMDFDKYIVDYIINIISKNYGVAINLDDISDKGLKRKRVLELQAEEAKKQLSFTQQVNITLDHFITTKDKIISIDETLTRSMFEKLIQYDIDKTFNCINRALDRAKLKPEQIDYVLAVGGSSRIPMVRERLVKMFGSQKVLAPKHIDPDRAVAIGAAIQAAIIEGVNISAVIMDTVPHSLGTAVVVQLEDGRYIDKVYDEIIKVDSPMLKEYTMKYSTLHDNQDSINVRVYQKPSMCDSIFVDDMIELVPENPKDTKLTGIPPSPANEQAITTTFFYNLNGILDVRAKIDSTGKEIKFSVRNTFANSTDTKKVEDAWKHSEMAKQIQNAVVLVEGKRPDLTPSQLNELDKMLEKMKAAANVGNSEMVNKVDDEINEYLFEIV